MRKDLKIIISTHIGSAYAPSKPFIEYVLCNFDHVGVIYHPFDSTGNPSVYEYREGAILKKRIMKFNTKTDISNYLLHIFYNFYFTILSRQKYDIFVGIDCLNAFCGLILKKFMIVDTLIFYTADYSKRRFSNNVMNKIYHILDTLCVRYSDYVWNVSEKICEIRAGQRLEADKNIYVPNGVHLSRITPLPLNEVNRRSYILVGHLTRSKGAQLVIDIIPSIIAHIPDAQFTIIGDGPYRGELERRVKALNIDNHVTFLGSLNNNDVLDEIAHHGVGIALYTNDEDYAAYCSPVKVKEYLAAGCPVIISNVPPISEDIIKYNLGFVITNVRTEFIPCALKLLDEATYRKYRTNAIQYASHYDWDAIYNKSFKTVRKFSDGDDSS